MISTTTVYQHSSGTFRRIPNRQIHFMELQNCPEYIYLKQDDRNLSSPKLMSVKFCFKSLRLSKKVRKRRYLFESKI